MTTYVVFTDATGHDLETLKDVPAPAIGDVITLPNMSPMRVVTRIFDYTCISSIASFSNVSIIVSLEVV